MIRSRRKSHQAAWTIFLLLLGLAFPAWAQNDLCIPALGGLTPLPTLDGDVETDTGWSGATQFNLDDGIGALKSGTLYLGRGPTDIYLGLVIDSPAPDPEDVVVLALSTDGNASNDWRLHLKPWDAALPPAGTSQMPHIASAWRNSSSWNTGVAPDASITWPKTNTRVIHNAGRWQLEMTIPWETNAGNANSNNKIYFPATGPFSLFADIVSTSILLGTYTESPWPATIFLQPPSGQEFLERSTPPLPWGVASLNSRPACTGLSLAWNQVGTTNSPQHTIKRYTPPPNPFPADCTMLPDVGGPNGPNNQFFADIQNDMGAPAPNVSVTFRLANWGIGTPWIVLGSPTPAQTVNPPNQMINMNWQATYKQSCFFAQIPHQCILVEMDSTDPSVRFKNRSVTRNMDFVPASVMSRVAQIGTHELGAPPAGRTQHEYVLDVDHFAQKYALDGYVFHPKTDRRTGPPRFDLTFTSQDYPKGLTEALIWTMRGCIKTGRFLVINGKRYENCRNVGSFGYVAGHNGPVTEWKQSVRGPGLVEVAPDLYTLQVAPRRVVDITTTIEAVEEGRGGLTGGSGPWSLSLHAGVNDPQGKAANVLIGDTGYGVDLEYRFNSIWAAELFYGRDQFDGTASVGNVKVNHLSLNAKAYFSGGTFRPYLLAGLGLYDLSPGSQEPGFDVGAGLQFSLTQNLAVGADGRYHWVDTSPDRFEFLTWQAFLRFFF